jgi:hypothetical protein
LFLQCDQRHHQFSLVERAIAISIELFDHHCGKLRRRRSTSSTRSSAATSSSATAATAARTPRSTTSSLWCRTVTDGRQQW